MSKYLQSRSGKTSKTMDNSKPKHGKKADADGMFPEKKKLKKSFLQSRANA